MKRLMIAAALVAAISYASDLQARSLGDRLGTLPAAEYGFLASRVADCGLTQHILDSGKGREANPIFGRHPSAVKLWSLCAATGLAHAYGVSLLQDSNLRVADLAAKLSFGVGLGIVGWNLRIAL